MSVENFDYEKIQKILSSQGWEGTTDDLIKIISEANNESFVFQFIEDLKNVILKPHFDTIRPNWFNSPDRVALFEDLQSKILDSYKEPCYIDYTTSEGHVDLVINCLEYNIQFDISWSSTLYINKCLGGDSKNCIKEEFKLDKEEV